MGHLHRCRPQCDLESSQKACTMGKEDLLDDVHIRILRVTEDLRIIQRELNCAAMQAPGDPELMEALTQLPELDSIETLKSALDQMRHFLWFYMQVMTSDGEPIETTRQADSKKVPAGASFIEKFNHLTDAALMKYFNDTKGRKPN
jgi:hypothetical protein